MLSDSHQPCREPGLCLADPTGQASVTPAQCLRVHPPAPSTAGILPPRGAPCQAPTPSPRPAQHSLLGAPGLGLAVQVDETQEVHTELEHDREDSVQVEDVGQGPLSGEGLEGL